MTDPACDLQQFAAMIRRAVCALDNAEIALSQGADALEHLRGVWIAAQARAMQRVYDAARSPDLWFAKN